MTGCRHRPGRRGACQRPCLPGTRGPRYGGYFITPAVRYNAAMLSAENVAVFLPKPLGDAVMATPGDCAAGGRVGATSRSSARRRCWRRSMRRTPWPTRNPRHLRHPAAIRQLLPPRQSPAAAAIRAPGRAAAQQFSRGAAGPVRRHPPAGSATTRDGRGWLVRQQLLPPGRSRTGRFASIRPSTITLDLVKSLDAKISIAASR